MLHNKEEVLEVMDKAVEIAMETASESVLTAMMCNMKEEEGSDIDAIQALINGQMAIQGATLTMLHLIAQMMVGALVNGDEEVPEGESE